MSSGPASGAADEADAGGEGATAEADPLVSNGLGSPSCHGGLGATIISRGTRGNCETSGFAAAAAPTGDFGLDVHIDTGLLGLSSGGLLASVQDLCVTPLWMALVWAVHALLVMLEWCFEIDLLDSPSIELGIARGLRETQATFTLPWLGATLAVGAVALAYGGLVRRRVGESLGQGLLALAMTAAGLSVMLDPSGTVGAIGAWANSASLATFAATARGSPSGAGDALDGEMRIVFAAVVEGPWCYLEFGQVEWCRDPRRLDPALHAAAIALAAQQSTRIGCGAAVGVPGGCVAAGSPDATALARSARLLRSARTNGAIFLALPANGAARNSINDTRSLLRAICRSEDATRCRGPSASEAAFRTNRGTWPRVGGLVLIVVGALGMLLLLGYVALRLLAAALFSLLYLLLAPLLTLAPALGEAGRAAFARWATQLLGAVVSKLIFSFVLGAILAVLAILASLQALGWWTQWLLMSAFWWAAFMRRHQALALLGSRGEHERQRSRGPIARRAPHALDPRRRIVNRFHAARERHARRLGEREQALARPQITSPDRGHDTGLQAPSARAQAPDRVDAQARRLLAAERSRASVEQVGTLASRAQTLDERLRRMRHEHGAALAAGDRRRAARLHVRGERLAAQAGAASGELAHVRRATGNERPADADVERERARFLDAQARLPGAIEARRAGAGEQREYLALAALAGHTRREYERLAPREQRVARLAIDRELAIRREGIGAGARSDREMPRRPWSATRETAGGQDRAADAIAPSPVAWREPRPSRPGRGDASESSVMQDARAVAERRKRQLGIGRP